MHELTVDGYELTFHANISSATSLFILLLQIQVQQQRGKPASHLHYYGTAKGENILTLA